MATNFICSSRMSLPAAAASKPPVFHSPFNLNNAHNYGNQQQEQQQREKKKSPILFKPFAAKSGGGFSLDSILKRCQTCGGQGAVDCPGCKGTGKNKKNGNMFERWKCYDCQGFGLKSCPSCGKGRGLTPEQRGER